MKSTLTKKQLDEFKKSLSDERDYVEKELKTVSINNPNIKEDWVPEIESMSPPSGDIGDQSSQYADYQRNIAITAQLETRYNNIKDALERMEKGTYGICMKSGNPDRD